MPISDKEVIATLKRPKRGNSVKLIGISNDNPLLDTRLYEVELPNSSVEELVTNTIS